VLKDWEVGAMTRIRSVRGVSADRLLGRADWVDAVLTTRDADVRSHRVALTYAKYAALLAEVVDPEPIEPIEPNTPGSRCLLRIGEKERQFTNANWFHFATWGTLTITRNIANVRPPQRLDSSVMAPVRRYLTPLVVRERAGRAQQVGRALSWGQILIFLSTCTAFKVFKNMVDEEHEDWRHVFGEHLHSEISDRAGRELRMLEENMRLDRVAAAFDLYRLAHRYREHPRTNARLVLGANVLLTAVEQELAQVAVAKVIDQVPQRWLERADHQVARHAQRWTTVPRPVVETQLPFRYAGARHLADAMWARMMTDQVLVMVLPTETLRLGRDIPPLDLAKPFYPSELRDLAPRTIEEDELRDLVEQVPGPGEEDGPEDGLQDGAVTEGAIDARLSALLAALHEAADVVHSYDRTRGGGRGSAANDWRRFDDRMSWAVALMRSRQKDGSLGWDPYSEFDEELIVAGQPPQRGGDASLLEVLPPLNSDAYGVET
jgi:hypothetical protein